jgi:anthranilate/para-aminobenzoate synthase component II
MVYISLAATDPSRRCAISYSLSAADTSPNKRIQIPTSSSHQTRKQITGITRKQAEHMHVDLHTSSVFTRQGAQFIEDNELQ